MSTEKILRIAVIDDHELYRKGLVSILAGWERRHVVLEAENGKDYEERCAEVGHVDLALVDVRMPVRDGFETLRWMQRNQQRTRALIITYEATAATVRKALALDARGVLDKAVRSATLHASLNDVLLRGFHYNALVSRDLRRTVEAQLEAERPQERWASLTPRQREVLRCFADPGVRNLAEVGVRLGITEDTAETHRRDAYLRLGIHSKDELVRYLLTNDLP